VRKLGTGIIGRVGALAISIATVVGCGDNGVVPIDAAPEVDAPIDAPLPPAQLSISPLTSDFGSQTVGNTSSAMSFTVTNTGGSPSGSISAQIMGSGSANFAVETTTCTTLDVNATCTVQVSFTPATPGQKTANLVVSATPGGSVTSALDGTGIALGDILLTPGNQAFGNVVVGATSATAATFTVTNTGGTTTGTLNTTMTGSDAGDFEVETDTCDGATLAGSATCMITVSFSPTSAGAKTASLQVAGTPGGTTSSALTGNALENARLVINPTILDFGTVVSMQSSGNQTFTVTNAGGVASGGVTPALTGADAGQFFIASGNCSAPLNPGASCNVIVQFRPTSAGAKAAQLAVSGSPGGTASASLLGTGQIDGQITITPGTVTYNDTTVGAQSASQVFTVTNTGGATTSSLATALGGNDPAHFQIVNGSNGCQGTALAAGANCTIAIVFAPTSGGPKSANITVSGTPGGTAIAGLNGDALIPATLTISPASRDFGNVGVGSLTGFQTFTINNTGDEATGTLTVALNGAQAGQFQMTTTCAGTLAVGANCTAQVRFAPSINGAAAATLDVSASPGGAVSAGLFGAGVPPADLVDSPPGSINMDNADGGGPNGRGPTGQTLLGDSSQRTYTLTNNGTEPTGVIAFTEAGADQGDFSHTHDCPLAAGLPSGMSCTVTVTFTPTVRGLRTYSLVATAAPGGIISKVVTGNSLPRLELLAPPQNPHPFGGQVVNTTAPPQVQVRVKNNTRAALGLPAAPLNLTTTPAFDSTANGGSAPYQFNGGDCLGAGVTLASEAECFVNVQFEPDAVGPFPGSVTFAINGGGAFNTATQNFTGSGVDSMFIEAVTDDDFGIVAVGKTSNALSFVVTNPAQAPATGPIGTSISSNRFQIIGDTCAGNTLAPGATCIIQVRFLPITNGVTTADLTVSANPGGTTFITLTGTGVSVAALQFTPAATIAFPDTFSGEFSDRTLVISNPNNSESSGPLSFALTGADMALYTINPAPAQPATDCAPGQVLDMNESCTIRLRFSPTGNTVFGDRSAVTLSVSANPGTALAGATFGITANSLSSISISAPAGDPFNFGTLNQGQTVSQVFTVRNNSGHAVTVSGAEIDPDELDTTVTANGCTAALAANGGTCTITVQFSSPDDGVYERDLEVTATDGFAVRGTVATVNTPPALSWSPATFDYGTILAGSGAGATVTYTLTNTGEATSAAPTVTVIDVANYTLTNTGAGSCSTFTTGLTGGATCTVRVQFTPPSGGTGGQKATMLMAMAGTATATANLTGRLMEPQSLVLSPISNDFGNDLVDGNGTAGFTFTLQNTSNASQTYTVDFTDTQFSQIGGTCAGSVGPNLSCTIIVSFNADDDGAQNAQLQVYTGGSFGATDTYANLRGNGQDPASVACVLATPFPAANPVGGTPGTQTYTCTNSGDVPSGAVSIGAMSGADPGMFAATGCGAAIPAGQSCTITVTFTPANVGLKSASFTVSASPGMAINTINMNNVNAVTQATLGITPTAQQVVADRAIGAIDGTGGTPYVVTNGGAVSSGNVVLTSSDGSFVIEAGTAPSCNVTPTGAPLAAGASCNFVVKFNPVGAIGPRTATIQAAASPGGTVSGSITAGATSALTVGGDSGTFPGMTAPGGQSAARTFVFTNNAAVATGLLSTTFDGTNEVDFSIVTDDCAGKVLTAFGTATDDCSIVVRFVPRANGGTGSRTASISVAGTPGNAAAVTLQATAGN
jgi:hypothetical protein